MNKELENEINIIRLTELSKIASILSCSENQAGKFRRGFSELSNSQAQKLKKELGLQPRAFVEIYKDYQLKKEKKSNK